MRRIPLESSTLASALYTPESREPEVEFQSGRIYRCFSVPPEAYHDLLAALPKAATITSKSGTATSSGR